MRSSEPRNPTPTRITKSLTGTVYIFSSVGQGAKLWRVRYRFAGIEKLLSIGAYPEVGLRDARDRRDEAKRLIASGIDPSFEKKRKATAASLQAINTFKGVALEYIDKLEVDGMADATRKKIYWLASLLEKVLGNRPISEIEPFEVVSALKKIEKRGNFESAKRARSFASRVFKYAIWTARAKVDPAADVGGALKSPKLGHHAAIITPEALGALLGDIEAFEGHAEWSEFDFNNNCWRIPAPKMKMGIEHVVPLSRQSVEIVSAIPLFQIQIVRPMGISGDQRSHLLKLERKGPMVEVGAGLSQRY